MGAHQRDGGAQDQGVRRVGGGCLLGQDCAVMVRTILTGFSSLVTCVIGRKRQYPLPAHAGLSTDTTMEISY